MAAENCATVKQTVQARSFLTEAALRKLIFEADQNGLARAVIRVGRRVLIDLDFIRPGKPVENAFIESFNGRFRDECLSQNWFTDIADAQAAMPAWARDYNESRPHTSLGGLAPQEYVAQLLAGEVLKEAAKTENLPQPLAQRWGRVRRTETVTDRPELESGDKPLRSWTR